MAIEKRKTKKGVRYRVVIYDNYRRVHTKVFTRKADARRHEMECKIKLERGESLEGDRRSKLATFDEVMDRYLDERTPRKVRNNGKDESKAKRIRTDFPKIVALPIRKVSKSHIVAMRDAWSGRYSATYVVTLLNFVSAIFTAAEEWEIVDFNPVRKVKKPTLRGTERDRRLSADEEARVLSAIRRTGNRDMYDIVVLAIETGMRRSEIVSLTWENVFLDEGYLFVDGKVSKNFESRYVPLSDRALAVLKHRHDLSKSKRGVIFYVRADSVTQAWRRACARAGVQGVRFHDLRHEAISRMSKKVDALSLSRIVGHRDLRMTRRYYNPTPAELVARLRGVSN